MESNDIAVRLALRAIIIRDTLYQYRSSEIKPLHKTVRRAVVLWAPLTSTTIWRGEFLEEALPDDVLADNEPRTDTRSARSTKISLLWPPPGIVSCFADKIGIPNLSKYWNATDNFVKSTTPSVQQTLFNNQGLLFIPLKDNNKRKKNTLVPAQLASILKTTCASISPLSFAQLLTSLTTYSVLKSNTVTVLLAPLKPKWTCIPSRQTHPPLP